MDQVTLACIRNPFDPHGSREVRLTDSGKTIAEHLAEFYPEPPEGYDVTVSVDGRIYADPLPYITQPGQSIVFCATPRGGDGKNPLATIAMLAVVVVATIYGGPLGGAVYAGLGGVGTAPAIYGALGTMAIAKAGLPAARKDDRTMSHPANRRTLLPMP